MQIEADFRFPEIPREELAAWIMSFSSLAPIKALALRRSRSEQHQPQSENFNTSRMLDLFKEVQCFYNYLKLLSPLYNIENFPELKFTSDLLFFCTQ